MRQLVEGGIDFIKDDELQADGPHCPFNERGVEGRRGGKAAAERHPGALIIHVEPYIMEWNGERMIPTLDAAMHLQPNEAARACRLPVEPWIYTVDGNGIVIHSFEGVIGDDELDAAIKEIDAD